MDLSVRVGGGVEVEGRFAGFLGGAGDEEVVGWVFYKFIFRKRNTRMQGPILAGTCGEEIDCLAWLFPVLSF